MIDGFGAFVLGVFVWTVYTDQQEALERQGQMQEIVDRLFEDQIFKELEPPTNGES